MPLPPMGITPSWRQPLSTHSEATQPLALRGLARAPVASQKLDKNEGILSGSFLSSFLSSFSPLENPHNPFYFQQVKRVKIFQTITFGDKL